MSATSWLLALLALSAVDALRGGGGAMTGGSRVALKSGAQSQLTQPVTPRSVVVLHLRPAPRAWGWARRGGRSRFSAACARQTA